MNNYIIGSCGHEVIDHYGCECHIVKHGFIDEVIEQGCIPLLCWWCGECGDYVSAEGVQ